MALLEIIAAQSATVKTMQLAIPYLENVILVTKCKVNKTVLIKHFPVDNYNNQYGILHFLKLTVLGVFFITPEEKEVRYKFDTSVCQSVAS